MGLYYGNTDVPDTGLNPATRVPMVRKRARFEKTVATMTVARVAH
jgi:hypothetical protein